MADSAVPNSAELETLQQCCRDAVDDPSELSQKLRKACSFLGTGEHDRAEKVVGTIVAVNASRMLSVTWTVLFQRLRESDDVKVKLSVIQQFANISGGIAVQQRPNAFRVFASEALELLSNVQVVVDRSFLRSFDRIMSALGHYAELDLCQPLFAVILSMLATWTKSDAVRAAASMAAKTVECTSVCGTFSDFLTAAGDRFELFVNCLLLDQCTPPMIAEALRLYSHPAQSSQITALKTRFQSAIKAVFFAGETQTNAVAPILSCYSKLRECDAQWEFDDAEALSTLALKTLGDAKRKKIVVSPLLQFLATTRVSWWKTAEVVWQLAEDDDPLCRGGALTALTNAANHVEDVDLLKCKQRLIAIQEKGIAENCTYTVSGALKLLAVILPRLVKSHCVEKSEGCRVVAKYLDQHISVNRNTTVQVALLNLLQELPFPVPGAISFTVECALSEHAGVRGKALELLRFWCFSRPVDYLTLFEADFGAVEFLEESIASYPEAGNSQLSFLTVSQNVRLLLGLFCTKLTRFSGRSDGDRAKSIQMACDGVMVITASIQRCFSEAKPFALELQSIYLLLCDVLLSPQFLPINVFAQLLKTCSTCVKTLSGSDSFDIFAHLGVFNYVWNTVHRCCNAIDPITTPVLRSEECLYFSHTALNGNLGNTVAAAAESALTNAEPFGNTEFCHLLEQSIGLLCELTQSAKSSPIFVGHLRNLHRALISCLHVIAGCSAAAALRLTSVVFDVLFHDDLLNGRFDQASHTVPAQLESISFLASTVTVLARSLSNDFGKTAESVFGFFELVAQCDNAVGSSVCYDAADRGLVLFHRMVRLITQERYYSPKYGKTIIAPAFRALKSVFYSPLKSRVKRATPEATLRKAQTLLEAASTREGESAFRECKMSLDAILQCYQESETSFGVVVFRRLTDHSWRTSEEYFTLFEQVATAFANETATMMKEMRALSSSAPLHSLLCAAAVLPERIPQAVSQALRCKSEPFLVELLIAVEMEYDGGLPPLELCVAPEVVGVYDDLLVQLIRGYRGGWWRSSRPSELQTTPLRCENSLLLGHLFEKTRHPPTTPREKDVEKQPVITMTSGVEENNSENVFALPFSARAATAFSDLLLDATVLNEITLRELMERGDEPAVWNGLHGLIREGRLGVVSPECVIQLTRRITLRRWRSPFDNAAAKCVVQRLVDLLQEGKTSEEVRVSLQYSSLFLLCWMKTGLLLQQREQHSPPTPTNEGENALDSDAIRLISCCTQVGFTSARDVALYVVDLFVQTPWSMRSREMVDLVRWMTIYLFPRTVWEVITAEEVASSLDPACLQLLCSFSQTAGFPAEVVEEMHAQYTPLLLSYGTSRELDADQQRYVLWLTTSTMLHLVPTQETVKKGKVRVGLVDALREYDDCDAGCLRTEAEEAIHRNLQQFLFPAFTRSDPVPTGYEWNVHVAGQSLPIGLSPPMSRPVNAQITTSLLHMFVHVTEGVFAQLGSLPPYYTSDALYSLETLSVSSDALVKPIGSPSGAPAATTLFRVVWSWVLRNGVFQPETTEPTNCPWQEHVGLFPEACSSLGFPDFANLSAATTVLGGLVRAGGGSAGTEGADLCSVLSRMLCSNSFLYVGGLTATLAACQRCTETEVAPFVDLLMRHLSGSLRLTQWATLSLAFAARLMLRCLCATLVHQPEEQAMTKMCEGVWNALTLSRHDRALLYYSHHLLDAVIHSTPVGSLRWELLRALVMDNCSDERYRRGSKDAGGRGPSHAPGQSAASPSIVVSASLPSNAGRPTPQVTPSRADPIAGPITMAGVAGHSFRVRRLGYEEVRLLALDTQSALLLRGTSSSPEGDDADHHDVLLLVQQPITLTTAGFRAPRLLCFEVLGEAMLRAEESFFSALNHFNFSIKSRRNTLHELLGLLRHYGQTPALAGTNSTPPVAGPAASQWLELFVETTVGRASCEEEWWWIAQAAFVGVAALANRTQGEAVATVIVFPLPASQWRSATLGLLTYCARTQQRPAAKALLELVSACTAACTGSRAVLFQPLAEDLVHSARHLFS